MKALTSIALDTAQSRGATYADVRIMEYREQTLRVEYGTAEALASRLTAASVWEWWSKEPGALLPTPS